MLYRPCHQRNVPCSPNSSIDTLPCSSLSFPNSKGVIQQAHFWHLIQPFSTSTLGNSSRRSQCNENSLPTVSVHFCMVQQGEVGVFPLLSWAVWCLIYPKPEPLDDGRWWRALSHVGTRWCNVPGVRVCYLSNFMHWACDWHTISGLISCVMPFSSLRMFWILAFTWSITALKIKTSTDISLFKWLLRIACPSQPSTPFSHPFDLSDKKGVKFPDWTKLWLKQT